MMTTRVVRAGLVLATAVAPLSLHAQAKAAAPKAVKGVTVEGITEYALPNGMKVLLVPDASKPTVTVNLTIFSGSKHEGLGETGMAHLIEHMIFKGSKRHPNVPKELNDHGANWNGTTWYDRTNYFETVKATDENLDWALDLEADRFVNSFMKKADLQSEFTVVRNEFEAGENSAFRVLMARVMSAQFLWHNYGKSTIGNKTDIENVPIERLTAFYKRNYQPDNAMVVVAGKFDDAKTLKMIEQKFGTIPKPVRSLDRGNLLFDSYTTEPTQDGERETILRRVGDEQIVMAAFHVPAGTHPDYPAITVLSTILGEDVSGRLYKSLVDTKIATGVASFSFPLRDPGTLLNGAILRKEGDLAKARQILVAVLDSAALKAPTDEELTLAKTKLLKDIDLGLNSSDQVGVNLSEWASMGDWRFLFIARDRINAVTSADVQRVAKQYLVSSNRTMGEFHPTQNPIRAEVPAAPDYRALVASYKGGEKKESGEAFDPAPAAIDARIAKSTLANGMRVELISRKTRGGVVNASIVLRYGTEQSLTRQVGPAIAATSMLERGTATRSRQQLKAAFDSLKANVSFGGGVEEARVGIEVERANLIPVLTLVAEALKSPAFPADEFEKLREETLSQLEQSRSQPQPLGIEAARRALSPYPPGHPLYVATTDERIAAWKALTVNEAKAFWTKFAGASHGDVAISGEIDAAAVTKTLAAQFGNWTSAEPYARIPHRSKQLDSTVAKIETPDKQMAVFVAAQPLTLKTTDPDWAALRIANFIFGESPLSDRVGTRLRQKEGLSYGAGSQMTTEMKDSAGSHISYAIYAPQNAERLVAAYKEELERALKDGFTDEEITKAKQAFLDDRFQQRSENSNLPGMAIMRADNGLTFQQWDGGIEERVKKLTPADVNAAFKKYVSAKNVVWVTAGDFEGAKKKAAAPKP